MNDESVKKISSAVRKERRWKVMLVAAIVALAVGLTGLFVLRLADRTQSRNQQRLIEQVVSQISGLCETGALDCRGQRGLPGYKGIPGTGIQAVACANGRFRFTFTNGTVVSIGDCIARDGSRGPRGFRGLRGFRGPRGLQGKQGAQGAQGHRGARGPAGPPGIICHPNHCRTLLDSLLGQVSGNRVAP